MARPMPWAAPVTSATGALTRAMVRTLVLGLGLGRDREIGSRSPFRPRTVVERFRFLAERLERKPDGGGGAPGAAACDYRLVDINSTGGKGELELFRRQ